MAAILPHLVPRLDTLDHRGKAGDTARPSVRASGETHE